MRGAAIRSSLGLALCLVWAVGVYGDELPAYARPTAAEREAMWDMIETWNARPEQGDDGLLRERSRDQLLRRYGLRAIPVLVECLDRDSYWFRRTAASACRKLVVRHGRRARELLLDRDVPAKLIDMFGAGPWAERRGLNLELHAALQALTRRRPFEDAVAEPPVFDDPGRLERDTRLLRERWSQVWDTLEAQREAARG